MKRKIHLFRQFCLRTFLILVLFSGVSSVAQSNFYLGNLDQTAWDNLITEINTKKASLESKITQAEELATPLETSYAKVSVYTVGEFLIYAAYDRQNAATLQPRYEGQGFSGFNNDFENQILIERGSVVDYSVFHPFQQLYDCTKILNKAIAEIDDQLTGNIVLAETPDFTTSGFPTLATDASYYMKDGNVIFPSSQWGLTADNNTISRQENLMETLGYLGSLFHSPQVTSQSGSSIVTNSGYATNEGLQLGRQISNNQTPTQVHFTHTGVTGRWTGLYPDIDDFKQTFIHYDIDHPNLNDVLSSTLGTFVPDIVSNANDSPLVYVISNEPRFHLFDHSTANQGVSNYTYNAYVEHLKTEYGNDINALNAVYNPHNSNQNFANFDALKNAYTIPLNGNTQGTPIWYDWLRFNMNRSNRWHSDLKGFVRASDPDAKVSIKILGRSVEDPIKDDGIDPEGLMDLQEVIGFDNQVVPRETHGRNNRFYKDYIDHYVMDWREQAIMLDFAKSLYPKKPTFDSEWHAISSNAWDNFALDEGYTRSALWMAFTNGLSMINGWWWYRDEDGSLQNKVGTTGNIMFSPQHQAIVFDEYGRTMKELNAHGNTIATLVPDQRDYLIYFSLESAIQDLVYSQQMSDIYEALKLLNVKVGFTTENKINSLGYTPKGIIIPPTLFIKDSSLDALNFFSTNNSSVDIMQFNRGSNANFSKDEKGTNDNARTTSFINKTKNFTNDIPSLIDRLRIEFSFPNPVIDFQIFEPGTSTEAFGVFASEGQTPDNKNVISLINLSLEDRDIQLTGPATDLITGETISATHTMAPYDVLLLTDGSSLSTNKVEKKKSYLLYPNPVSDILIVKNAYQGKYSIYSINGSLVKTFESNDSIVEIPVNGLSTGLYFIEIPTAEGIKIEKIIIN